MLGNYTSHAVGKRLAKSFSPSLLCSQGKPPFLAPLRGCAGVPFPPTPANSGARARAATRDSRSNWREGGVCVCVKKLIKNPLVSNKTNTEPFLSRADKRAERSAASPPKGR